MKFINSFFSTKSDRELFGKIIVCSVVILTACSSVENKNRDTGKIKISYVYNRKLDDFDQVHIPNKEPIIAKMISILKPEFSVAKRNEFAKKIHLAFLKYKIEPQLIVAILDTESDFNHEKISVTGDLSMAQVNVEVWNKEFQRMNVELIERDKLIADQAYSLDVMARILQVLKKRYQKSDRRWYARYHSRTKKHKNEYLAKINTRLKILKKSDLLASN